MLKLWTQAVRILAHEKLPAPHLPPVIDRAHPTFGRGKFSAFLFINHALNLKDQRHSIGEADDEIRKKGMAHTEELVRN